MYGSLIGRTTRSSRSAISAGSTKKKSAKPEWIDEISSANETDKIAWISSSGEETRGRERDAQQLCFYEYMHKEKWHWRNMQQRDFDNELQLVNFILDGWKRDASFSLSRRRNKENVKKKGKLFWCDETVARTAERRSAHKHFATSRERPDSAVWFLCFHQWKSNGRQLDESGGKLEVSDGAH